MTPQEFLLQVCVRVRVHVCMRVCARVHTPVRVWYVYTDKQWIVDMLVWT